MKAAINHRVKEFTCELTGIKTIITYLEDKARGCQSVEFVYPPGYLSDSEQCEKRNKKLPKSKQVFINPANGREISYYRAKALGLVK